MRMLEYVALTVDELEAIRLADLEGLYQEQAAAHMNVSRQTFGRILEAAHKKVAEALVHGKALSIEGGSFEVPSGSASGLHGQGRGGSGRGKGRCHRGGRQAPV